MPLAPPNTVAQLSHAVTIRVNSRTIGAINEWNPRMTKTVTELYEFGNVTDFGPESKASGEPFAKVPGNVSGMEIGVRRYDTYNEQMEAVFGTADITMLSQQLDPFECHEVWIVPNNFANYFNRYRGCWFSNLGRTLSTTGDRTVNVDATLQYTRKDKEAI